MQFITKNSSHSTLHISYKEKYIEETNNTKFLGSEISTHTAWFVVNPPPHPQLLRWTNKQFILFFPSNFKNIDDVVNEPRPLQCYASGSV
jgi:hypothetical protein